MKIGRCISKGKISKNILTMLTLFIPGGDRFAHQLLFLRLSQKFFPATYDETLCKFLFCTYEDSCNLIWSKKLSRGHVVDIYVAWVQNSNFRNCKFGYKELFQRDYSYNKSCLELKNTKGKSPLFFQFSAQATLMSSICPLDNFFDQIKLRVFIAKKQEFT